MSVSLLQMHMCIGPTAYTFLNYILCYFNYIYKYEKLCGTLIYLLCYCALLLIIDKKLETLEKLEQMNGSLT